MPTLFSGKRRGFIHHLSLSQYSRWRRGDGGLNIRVSRRQIRDVNCENFERSHGISSFGRTTRPFDHPPPLTCACLCPWVSRFFHPNVHQARHDRSLSPPASKQPHARTRVRAFQRPNRFSPVCARGKHRSQTMQTGRRIHISRCTLARTPANEQKEREAEIKREWGKKEGVRGKKSRARKSLQTVETSEYGDGIADTEETRERRGAASRQVEKKKEKDRMGGEACKYFSSPRKIEPSLSMLSASRCLTISISLYLLRLLVSFSFTLFSPLLVCSPRFLLLRCRHHLKFFKRATFSIPKTL